MDIDDAVAAALALDWKRAIKINQELLKNDPNDVDSLNRLGKAYLETGEALTAAKCFKKVLRINKYDPIATKNLSRAVQAQSKGGRIGPAPLSPSHVSFLEEPGKTKLVNLVNLAPAKNLVGLDTANQLILELKRHAIFVCDQEKNYLGALPDDIGHRLITLMRSGNKYEAFVKSASKNSLVIFIREVFKSKKFKDTPSFAHSGTDYLTYIRDESGHDETKEAAGHEEGSDTEEEGTPKGELLHQDEEVEES